MFERVVGSGMKTGLVGGEGLAVDASVIEADASYALRVDGPALPPERADPATATWPVQEYLAALDAAAGQTVGKASGDAPPEPPGRGACAGQVALPHRPGCGLDVQRRAQGLVRLRGQRLGGPQARNRGGRGGHPGRWTEQVASTAVMIERTHRRFGLQPSRLAADAAHGSGRLVGWLMGRGIEPHVPVLDRERQTKGMLTRSDFVFDRERNLYVCPSGHDLRTTGAITPGGLRQYRAKPTSCDPCKLKLSCTRGLARMVTRNVHEDEREHVRSLAGTPEFKRSAGERRKVEMLFAHLKRNLGLRRLRPRGPMRAGDELLLAATTQNLRRLAQAMAGPAPHRVRAPA